MKAFLWKLLRKLIGILILLGLVALAYWLVGLLAAAIAGLSFVTLKAATIAFILWLILIIPFLLVLWLEKGTLTALVAGCPLRTFWLNPDKCVKTTCATTCIAIKGPYPSWMGPVAPGTQDILCFCLPAGAAPPGGAAGGLLQDLFDSITGSRDISIIIRRLEELMAGDPDDPRIGRLWELLRRKQAGEELTPEEQAELDQILGTAQP